jgi:hypothetical protein
MTARQTTAKLDKCPPRLKELIEREGNTAAAADLMKVSKFSLRDIAKGKRPMASWVAEKVEAALSGATQQQGTGMETDNAPKTYPDWNGKRRNVKTMGVGGKVTNTKAVPEPLADLIEKFEGAKAATARALGYSGWGPIQAAYEDSEKYKLKLHVKVLKVLAGEVPTIGPATEQTPDTWKLGLAIVLLSLSEYDRIDEMANILGGQRIFRKGTKAGWLLIYKFPHKEKTEQFKRLAMRDASEIVCP